MNLQYDILTDLYLEGYIPLSELTYFTTPKVKKIIKKTPRVTKKEFIKRSKPGDIIVAFSTKKQFEQTSKAKFLATLMASFQGIPYTTSKLILNNGVVGGYGLKVIKSSTENKVDTITLEELFKGRVEALLIRPIVSEIQKQKAISFVLRKKGLSYSNSDLLKTAWKRLLHKSRILKGKDISDELVKIIQKPLFCSNLISLAYKVAGFKERFNNSLTWETWPRDFILDKNTEKICKVDYT